MSIFAEKVAIVTGSASGIGRALAENLGRQGAQVVLADVQIDAANKVAHAIRAAGGKASASDLNVTDRSAVEHFVDGIAAEMGQIDFMFNNAGISVNSEFKQLTSADWERILDVNVRGVFAGTAAAYAVMIRQGHGHIVNTASLAGLIPSPGIVAYCASKHAVVGLSTALRAEAASYGVKVSVACPGFIRTPLFESKKVGDAINEESSGRILKLATTPDQCAARMLRGVARNKGIIPVTGHARGLWLAHRWFPGLFGVVAGRVARKLRRG